MLSVSFNISCNNTLKKMACNKSQTVNQLIQTALEKFKLDGKNGELFHNGKKLDSSLPIRLTNLVNNSKLVLVANADSKEKIVNIKLAVNTQNDIKSYILKTSNTRSLEEILGEFEQDNDCDIREGGEFELTVLNSKVGSNSKEIKTSLKSIIGSDVSSLVMRLTYLQANTNTDEQEKINEIQKQRIKDYQRQEREKREAEQRASEAVVQRQPETQTDKPGLASIAAKRQLNNPGVPNANQNEDAASVPKNVPAPSATLEDTAEEYNVLSTEHSNTIHAAPVEKRDTLYIPSTFSTYENPDDDYEMTVDQAQKYHKMIINSSKKRTAPKPRSKPTKYSIRIKFPDRLILQLEMDDPTAKLGHLVRKIDEYLVPDFQSNYNLRIGYPPFSKIPVSLTTNNTPLVDSPFFQDEKIVIIWEPLEPHANGPYILQNDVAAPHVKHINDLPEIQLETNRSNLPADSKKPPTHTSATSSDTPSHTPDKPDGDASKKVPKWFRPTR